MLIDDLMYKHWDEWVRTIPHPFLVDYDGTHVSNERDILEGEPFECPMKPFGGTEQLAFSPDGRIIAYTCRKKTGAEYAASTNSDIYLLLFLLTIYISGVSRSSYFWFLIFYFTGDSLINSKMK